MILNESESIIIILRIKKNGECLRLKLNRCTGDRYKREVLNLTILIIWKENKWVQESVNVISFENFKVL